MSRRIRVLERIAAGVEEAVVVYHLTGAGHEGVWRDEGAERRIVVAGVVVEQTRRVALLPREGAVGLEVACRGTLGAVGVVGAAGGRGRPACGQRGTSEVVAVQVVERAAALDRYAQTAVSEMRAGAKSDVWVAAAGGDDSKPDYLNRQKSGYTYSRVMCKAPLS